MNKPQLTEAEVRALRDRVFGKPVTDKEWENCKTHWLRPSGVAWLRDHDFPISETLQRREALKKSC